MADKKQQGLDIIALAIGIAKGKAEGGGEITLDAGEGYTITDPNDDGHLVISTTEGTTS